jgi:hypothetical protein
MKKSLRISIGTAVLCSVAGLVPTASAQNGTWTAYPGQSISYQAAVQQPINTDGSSKFKANGNAVIPVKFALSQGAGPFVFESTSTGCAYSYLSFAPTAAATFNDITELSADYPLQATACRRSGGQSARTLITPCTSTMVIIRTSQIARRAVKRV